MIQEINKLPTGKFGVIYADCPWTQKAWGATGLDGRPQHYPRMTVKELCAMPIANLADKDCFLFFWTTAPHLEQAFQVIKAWGFTYSSVAFTWVKLKRNNDPMFFMTDKDFHLGMGYTTRKNAEYCLLAKRGKPKRQSKFVREIILSPVREHSRKPDETYDRIEKFAKGSYLELFARSERPNWTSWGNETNKFKD